MKKEFNLEEALKGAKLVTRDGREVSEWKYFETYEGDYPITAIINGVKYSFTKKGEISMCEERDTDLFIQTGPKKCYVNVYANSKRIWLSISYPDKFQAKSNAAPIDYIKTIEITDEP